MLRVIRPTIRQSVKRTFSTSPSCYAKKKKQQTPTNKYLARGPTIMYSCPSKIMKERQKFATESAMLDQTALASDTDTTLLPPDGEDITVTGRYPIMPVPTPAHLSSADRFFRKNVPTKCIAGVALEHFTHISQPEASGSTNIRSVFTNQNLYRLFYLGVAMSE